MPGLLSDIAADYAAAAEREPMRRAVADKIQHGTARLSDVHDYAEGTGRALSSALTGNLTPERLPNGTLYYNIADRTITPMARQSCEEINRAAEEILALQDARDGVNLKAVPAEFPAERVEGLVDKAADAGEDFPGWLDEPIVNLCEHVADSFMKANADFRYKSGMSPRIRRDSYARCCDWCADLDGVYDYKDAPKEVYARHEFCRCVVTFENGRERQNVWTKERWTADQDELDRRREYGLTDERERGIVKAVRQERERTPGERNIDAAIYRQIRSQRDSSILVNEIIQNHEALQYYTPKKMRDILENAGYKVLPLSNGNLKGVTFRDGGGYKVNFGGDGIFQYHPENRSHHGGAYWKIQNGKERHLYGLDGAEK